MSANSFGSLFKVHTFGESHGPAMGVIIDGCPAGVPFSPSLVEFWCSRRRPGQKSADGQVLVSARNEVDHPKVLSGIFEGKTLGTPIAMFVENSDQRSQDYDKSLIRNGHADDLWQTKFQHRDYRGGGRASGRETVSRVMAAAVAEMFSQAQVPDLDVVGYSKRIGPHEVASVMRNIDRVAVDSFAARFPGEGNVTQTLLEAKEAGQSFGGVVEVVVKNVPAGLGRPVFKKIKAELAAAYMSIGATAAVEFGEGANSSEKLGTEFHQADSAVYGGIRGGITTGEDIICRVSFKPTSSIKGVAKAGRHDPCIVPRAVPVVEAMTWLVLSDMLLAQRLDRL